MSARVPGAERMRVLVLTDELEVGGTQRQIIHIVKGLDPKRFQPTVAYFRNRSFLADELERAGIPVVEIPKRGRIDLAFVLRLRRFLLDNRFDLMHCFAFSAELWGAIARRLLPLQARPVLVTSIRNKYDWYTPMQWRLKGWATHQSNAVIANSVAGGDHALKMMGMPAGSIDVIYNGVADVAPGSVAAAPDPVRKGLVTALFVGRLVEQKNLDVLLRAMRRLRDQDVPVRLLVAGDGPLRDAHAAQIKRLDLSGFIDLLGERSDVRDLMASADFLVLPSLREGLPNVILEAMATGRAVIASAVGGSVELVEPMETGLLFPNDDDAALADAMRRMVEDAPLRDRLGTAGRHRAMERFTVSAMTRAMQDVYVRCLAIATRAPAASL